MRAAPEALSPTSPVPPKERLFRTLLLLALPVLAENTLNIAVGLNDAYLANHLPADVRVDATAAVGTVAYLLWFIGLFSAALGTGATAVISRATGAKHMTRARAAAGQSLLLAAGLGVGLALLFYFLAPQIAAVSGLRERAADIAANYLRTIAPFAPALLVLFVCNACLRGAGDTRTPAIAMIVVNLVNVALTWSLSHGWWGLPEMGYRGIALGTGLAYLLGAAIQVAVLYHGVGKIRLMPHRLRLNPPEMSRVLRIGLPSAGEQVLMWGTNFYLVHVVNKLGPVASAAHFNAIRLESLSFTTGFAVGIATSTLVGQSLGMRDPARAHRVTRLALLLGAGTMGVIGLGFVLASGPLARFISQDPEVVALTSTCLFLTGFIQFGFGSYIIFASALRGAGDTRGAMYVNLISVLGVRLVGVFVVGHLLGMGLTAIWVVLCAELALRGVLMFARFRQGVWRTVRV